MAARLSNPQTLSETARFLALLNRAEADIQRRFLDLIGRARGVRTLEEIADLLESGRVDEALSVLDEVAPSFHNAIGAAYASSGQSTAAVLRRGTGSLIDFNSLNSRGVFALQQERARLIGELTRNQREATLEALTDGVRRGLPPKEMARAFRGSLGLTGAQQRHVNNFRRLLEQGDSTSLRTAMSRAIRDKRFDPSLQRAIRNGEPLAQAQVDKMVGRYQERYIIHRSNVIAQTEGLRATNMGDEEMWQQAVDAGVVDPDTLIGMWVTVGDGLVRDSHTTMNRQQRPFGVPFRSGKGSLLRFPGDPHAPASDTIECRCVVVRTLPDIATSL